jgi:hypothetical protein
MKESVAIAKDADRKKESSTTRSDNSIQSLRNEPERQLGSLRAVIGNIRREGGTPSVESISTELSVMPSSNRASALLALQQTHGNQYVQRVVTGIQAKLTISQPGDKYEQEADRVADMVMQMPEPDIQRQIEPEEKEQQNLQARPLADQITPLVQRQVEPAEEEELIQAKTAGDETPKVTPAISSSIQSMQGGGQPLPEHVRAFFEPRFNSDFSQVRVHTDIGAADTSRVLNAQAFTHKQDVFFGSRKYAPETGEGKRLLAHELTHVVQQLPECVEPNIQTNVLREAAAGAGIQRTPDRQNCGEQDSREIAAAHSRAIQMLMRINNILAGPAPVQYSATTMAPRFVRTTNTLTREQLVDLGTAFGIRDVERDSGKLRQIRRILNLVINGLRREAFIYQCDFPTPPWYSKCGPPGVYAWTGGIWDIHLCADFRFLQPESKARKIAHEALHKWGDTDHDEPDTSALSPEAYDWLLYRWI